MEHLLFLRDGVPEDDAIQGIWAVIAKLDREFKTKWSHTFDGGPHEPMARDAWREHTRGLGEIALIWEYGQPWLEVYCSLAGEIEARVLELLRVHLEPVTLEEIQDTAERSGPNRSAALSKLRHAEQRRYDERTARILTTALDSSDPAVRHEAAWGMCFLAWSAFGPVLQAALRSEGDPAQRALLERALRSCSAVRASGMGLR